MTKRGWIIGFSVAGLLATTSLPASAQVADFFCTTFSVGCPPPPPPPPPAPPPAAEPEPAPMKKKHHVKKKMKKPAAAPADAAPPADAPK